MKDFESDVLNRSHEVPVLVDFWAPWCGPCRTLGPIIERLAEEAAGRWVLVKVNTDEHRELASQYGIRSIPSVKLFHKGKVLDEFLGALPESEIRRWLEEALPSPHEATLVSAEELIAKGAYADAAKLLEPILETEPKNDRVRVLLADALLGVDPARALELVQDIGAGSDVADKAEGLRVLLGFMARAEHPENLPEDAVRERYLDGLKELRARDYANALEAFIEVMKRNRGYDNAGPGEVCKAIFKFLGIRHPVADQYYTAFTSALYS